MDVFPTLVTVIGLVIFETVSSVDNAVINADVLITLPKRERRWFLTWGLLIAVFVVRGLFPWSILLLAKRQGTTVVEAAPFLFMIGGTFLLLLFAYWLFLEEKEFAHAGERYLASRGHWFLVVLPTVAFGLLTTAELRGADVHFGIIWGLTLFLMVLFLKRVVIAKHKRRPGNRAHRAKLLYLEVVDTVFSIDGVLGAFAFTFNIPLIMIGNGIGALVVRQLTVGNIRAIRRYRFLKNGAMYSMFIIGAAMIAEGFGAVFPSWLVPSVTLLVVALFTFRSVR